MADIASPIGELRQLDERERRRVLATLSPDERAQVLSMLAVGEPVQPSFEVMAGFSPWLLKKIDLAREERGDCSLTPATREKLVGIFQDMVTGAGQTSDETSSNPPWWSLTWRRFCDSIAR